jgi:hypothetical protein
VIAFVFVSKEHPELYDTAERLVGILTTRRMKARLVDKLSSQVEDLLLMAEYGVVEETVVVLVDDTGVRGRLTQLPEPDELMKAIDRLRGFPTPQA